MLKRHYYSFVALLFVVVCFAYGLMSNAAEGEDITISSNTTWTAGTYTYRDITITNNATLTLSGTYTTDTDGTGVVINARTITVTSGAKISADGKGYLAFHGPGKGSPTGNFGSGAGYGGAGGTGDTETAGGVSYGSAVKPLDLGSGGGNSGGNGAGGGAINLNLTGDLVLGGTISANGNNVGSWSGAGSGGSIYIIATNMSGAGTITANGGSVSGNADGGGGRVALYHNGTYSLDPTKVLASNGGGATDGSVFVMDRTNKDVTFSKNIRLAATDGINTSGDPTTDGTFNLRNLTVTSNSTLSVGSKYTTDTDGSGISFNLSGNLTVDTGSKIDAKGLGYPKNTGEGKGGILNNNYGGGGAHGGNGGRGEVGVGGTGYDSTLFPSKLGSGGVTTRGAAGGGIIKVTASQIIINGSLDASASASSGDGATQGSGGAGGTIYLVTTSVTGAGTILANGSNGYGYSGGGGGGRIAIYADTSGFTANNITATKGLKGSSGASADGSVGTVFLYNTATGNVTASSDVTFSATQGVNRDGTARSDGIFYFNNLTVTNNATVTVGGTFSNDSDGRGVTINLDGNLVVDPGSTISATGQGYTSANGPGKGAGTSSTSGAGGSYGGLGGTSYNSNQPGPIYGVNEANFPYYLGSSGGAGQNGVGGSGGGAVTLRVLGNATINGSISANGANGTGGISGWKPGGGSGGSVFLIADNISGSGTISADGSAAPGDANYSPGAGGGGRVSLVYSTSQTVSLDNISADGGTAASTPTRDGAVGSINITQRVLPAAGFILRNPNNASTEYTNTENVEIVPTDGAAEKYKEAASPSELVPTFYASGWANISDGKDIGVSEGAKTVRAWLKDANELISSSIGSASITLDTTNPEITLTTNNVTTTSATTDVVFKLDDNLAGIDYITVDGVRKDLNSLTLATESLKPSGIKAYAAEIAYKTTVSLDQGSNSIEITTYDKAGNSASSIFSATRNAAASVSSSSDNTDDASGDSSNSASSSSSTQGSDSLATSNNDLPLNNNVDQSNSGSLSGEKLSENFKKMNLVEDVKNNYSKYLISFVTLLSVGGIALFITIKNIKKRQK